MRKHCWICKNSKIHTKFKFGKVRLNKCCECSFEFINQFPGQTQKTIYTEGYFQGKLSGAKGYTDYNLLESQLTQEANKKIALIKLYTNKQKLLDIGAGTGTFLLQAKKQGFQVWGNDISDYAIKFLKKRRIKTLKGSIENEILPINTFDIITAWDVIEHVTQPARVIKNIGRALKPNGFLFITTPDTESIDARILSKHWYGYKKIPEHVGFFNNRSLSKLLTGEGFKVLEIKPWGFYRNLDFVLGKLSLYMPFSRNIRNILKQTKFSNLSFFFPFTDCIVIAQKNED